MSEDEKRAWDRLPGESSKAYHHFCIYRDMGASRSLRQMAGIPGCTSVRRRLNRWSSRWRWVERCQQYDDYLEYQLRAEQEKERREMSKRHAKIAMLGQSILVKGMEELLAKVQNGEHNLACRAGAADGCQRESREAGQGRVNRYPRGSRTWRWSCQT